MKSSALRWLPTKGFALGLFAVLALPGYAQDDIIAAGSGGHACVIQLDGSVRCWGNDEFGQASPPTGAFVQLSAGFIHTCGLRANGEVVCWGARTDELLAPPVGIFSQMSTNLNHACGVRDDGTLSCWGRDTEGQASPPPGVFSQVSAGASHSCGLREDGTVSCWGRNLEGQATPPAGSFVLVSAGFDHTCGLSVDGAVKCWGLNDVGQLSAPSGTFAHLKTGVSQTCAVRTNGSLACWGTNNGGQSSPPGGTFTRVSASGLHACGVGIDGTVRCWGFDASGQAVPPAIPLVQISAGGFHSCGVGTDGAIRCWGDNSDGQASPPSGDFVQVSASLTYSCGLGSDGGVRCWGDNSDGQASPSSGAFTQVDSGRHHSCGLRVDGSISCWGDNRAGQASPPMGIFTGVSAGHFHSCGVHVDGTVSCWGDNRAGQASPPPGSFLAVSAGEAHTCGLRQDNTLSCWGSNLEGQASPPLGSFSQVAVGDIHSCALGFDGAARCWGNDFYGQSSPPIGTFTQLSGGFLHTCGLRPDQTGECWGYNGFGPITPPGDLTAIADPTSLRLDPTRLFNVSTLGVVAGDGLQAGFIVTGFERPFAVLGEAVDSSLDARLVLTTFPDGQLIDQNDTWQQHPTAQELASTLRSPATANDAAFIATLGPGAYVATMVSQDGQAAPGIVSVTALDDRDDTYPLNLSTQGSGAMTAGFIVTGNASRCYVVKAEGIGAGAMSDPALVVRRLDETAEGTIVDANDDWTSHPTAELVAAAGFAPLREAEAALAVRLSEGVYLAELFSMRQSEAQQRAIVAATEVVDDPALSDCDNPTPFQPVPVDDTVGDGVAVLTLQMVAPTNRCVTQDNNHCLAHQATRNVALREPVELIAQAQSNRTDDPLTFDWQIDDTALIEELASNRLRVRFQNVGNQDVTVIVSSPAAGSLSTTMRLRVLDPDAGRGR